MAVAASAADSATEVAAPPASRIGGTPVAERTVVLVFLKAPRPGFVKTRLARDVGAVRALRIYRALVRAQLQRLPDGWPVEIHYAPRGARAEMRAWLGARWRLHLQRGGDLGARLMHAFAGAFARGANRVIAIGADCPTLDTDVLVRASRALLGRDVVLGPARDGGYYLIGLRRAMAELFVDIPWSTSEVLTTTVHRARAARLSVRRLEMREDVDDHASWRRNAAHLR